MRNHMALALTGTLLLAACGENADPAGETEPPPSLSVESDDSFDNGAEAPREENSLIPARFHGVWDYEGGTCAPESDLRLDVSGDEILFYESVGTVTSVTPEGDDVNIALDMEGEGETWQQNLRLSLVGAGDDLRLHQSDGSQSEGTDDFPSKRCAE